MFQSWGGGLFWTNRHLLMSKKLISGDFSHRNEDSSVGGEVNRKHANESL